MAIHAFLNPAVAPRSVRGAGNLSAIITTCMVDSGQRGLRLGFWTSDEEAEGAEGETATRAEGC